VTPATASKPHTDREQERIRQEFEASLEGFTNKVSAAIETAESKMSPERRAKVDREANAFLNEATDSAKPSRRGA